ncbi:MAG TPA: PAS domain-containing protein [Candidatus Sulfotelmatobacter sp.]|jgi:PAS domain S-box-containing protein/diguanylate cyclase (GGDEF)-like protein|nr:PAS domain-containing protein [Candidatus Sulfotelmatobacter sp.]
MTAFHDPDLCRSILESLPSGLCVLDMEKKIVYWSEGAERITGYLRHEVIGHSCVAESLLHCDQSADRFCKDDCPTARTIKTAQPAEAIGLLHHKTGHEFPVRIRAVPVHNQHGSIIGAVETFEELQWAGSFEVGDRSLKIPGCVDNVTGVASMALMHFHLRQALATFEELQVPFSVLRLRLDGLEHFRASLGPEAGSGLLRVVARSLESTLLKTDFLGRWSEDQFLVILNGCQEECLLSVGERLFRMLAGDGIEWWGEHRCLPILIGEAAAHAGDTIESLMGRAQKSLETMGASRVRAASASSRTSGS